MPYRGRHRRATHRRRQLTTIAAVTATALIAPLALTSPPVSRAEVTTAAIDTLVNHPQWRLNASDPAVAAQIANLQQAMTEHGMAVDPAAIVAYRVPTVEGFVTYVTVHPETFTVRPNPELRYHTPDGDVPVAPAEVVSRLLEPSAEPAGVDCGIETNVKVSFCAGELVRGLLATDFIQMIDALAQYLGRTIDGIELPETQPTLDYLNRVIQNIKDFRVIHGLPIDTEDEIAAVWAAVDAVQAEAEALVGYLLNINPDDIVGMIFPSPLVDELVQDVETLKLQLEAITAAVLNSLGLPDLDEFDPAQVVYEVLPTAVSKPLNSATSATQPLSQPVAQPMEPTTAMVPAVGTVYKDTYVEEEPEWARNSDDCFLSDANAWYRRTCWTIDNQTNDASPDYTYWQFQMKAVSYPKQKRGMLHTWVEGIPMQDFAALQFDGTFPVPDQEVGGESGCASGTQSLSLSGGKPIQIGYSYSYSLTTCEQYTPKGYSDEGHWSNKWHFNPDRDAHGVGYGDSDTHQRSVGFNMGIKTSSSAPKVGWTMPTGTEVTKKYCC